MKKEYILLHRDGNPMTLESAPFELVLIGTCPSCQQELSFLEEETMKPEIFCVNCHASLKLGSLKIDF